MSSLTTLTRSVSKSINYFVAYASGCVAACSIVGNLDMAIAPEKIARSAEPYRLGFGAFGERGEIALWKM